MCVCMQLLVLITQNSLTLVSYPLTGILLRHSRRQVPRIAMSLFSSTGPRDEVVVVVCGGSTSALVWQGGEREPTIPHPMKADAKRKPARSYRLSPRWSVFTLDTQPRARDPNWVPRFNRSRRSPKNRKNPRGVPGIVFSFFFFFFFGERENKEQSCKTQRDSWARSYLPIGNFRKSGKIFQKEGNSLCHNADPISYKRWEISEVLCTLDCLLFSFLARFDNCNKSNYTSFIFYFFFLRQRTEQETN